MYKKILAGILLTIAVISLFTSAEVQQKIVDKIDYDPMSVFADTYNPDFDYNSSKNLLDKFGISGGVYNLESPPDNLYAYIPDELSGEGESEGEEDYEIYGPSTSLAEEGIERFLITDINNPGVPLAPTNAGVSKEGEGEDDKEKETGFIFELDKENNLKISFDSPTGTRMAFSFGSIFLTLSMWGPSIINLIKKLIDHYKSYEKPYRKPKKRRKKKVDEELKEDNYNKDDRF